MTGLSQVVGVIEDDASVRTALHRLFHRAGFEVSLFATGEEYLADPHRAEVDCLVIDVGLPGIGGLELWERIQTEGFRRQAVFISAQDDGRVRDRAVAAGAIGFFLKPFDNQTLKRAVSIALSLNAS